MSDSQVPWGVEALGGTVSDPAWRSKPSWYLLVTDDRMIPLTGTAHMAERNRREGDQGPRLPRQMDVQHTGEGKTCAKYAKAPRIPIVAAL